MKSRHQGGFVRALQSAGWPPRYLWPPRPSRPAPDRCGSGSPTPLPALRPSSALTRFGRKWAVEDINKAAACAAA